MSKKKIASISIIPQKNFRRKKRAEFFKDFGMNEIP